MLNEYALIQDIFDEKSYSNPAVCEVHFNNLKDVILYDALVRNLYSGKWTEIINEKSDRFTKRTKELLKKLAKQNRLSSSKAFSCDCPDTDHDWIKEALASHIDTPLHGVITSHQSKSEFEEPIIASIEYLSRTDWWINRSNSTRLGRQIENYLLQLNLLLRFSNSIMFIDPHLDPSKHHYRSFIEILKGCKRADGIQPQIEIHRICYEGSPQNRNFPSKEEWINRFTSSWKNELTRLNLSAEVFIWDDFHDRYFLSNLIGVSLQNGFDTTTNVNEISTWTKLGKSDKEDIQREFDPNANRHQLKHRFKIPE